MVAQRSNRKAQESRRQEVVYRLRYVRGGYDKLTLLDKIANFILATMYSEDHIEASLHIPSDPKRSVKKDASERAGVRDSIVGSLKQAYASSRLTSGANVVYRIAATSAEQLENSSEIDYDCVAVFIHQGFVWAACNYKVRSVDEKSKKISPSLKYASFNRLSDDVRSSVARAVSAELKAKTYGGMPIRGIRFLGITPAPSNDKDNAKYHAEMQLMTYIKKGGILAKGLKVGVSKGCCVRCMEVLDRMGVGYTERASNKGPKNWEYPFTPPASVVIVGRNSF